ncbi:MAG: 2-oxo acid dehydrogenase subunit E2 [Chloroflexi bacterium]|nr:2-oxo acid dehydrogenase subunit E2 [Chloroflexota bacterium]
MPITIELPQVGESVIEGVIVRWLKKPGEQVARYDPLVEVETDKVTMEVPAPVSGVLAKVLVEEGARVPMGSPICEIETTEAVPEVAGRVAAPTEAKRPPDTIGVLEEPAAAVGPTGVRELEPAEEAPAALREHLRLSPVVQQLAAEHAIPLEQVARIKGTGIGGRITKQDILRYIEERAKAPVPTPSLPREAAVEASTGPEEEAMPLTAVRRRIAENMVKSVSQVPMAWTAFEVDVTGLVRLREQGKEEFQRREGVELTYLPFIVKAVAESLKEHPKLNATWGGDRIVLKKRLNIGIAVAAAQGLVVPVIRDADHYGVAGLAKVLRDLIGRARENKLALQDVQGGTFTVNNSGALGSVISQAIINYPQAAILTTEAIVKRVVADGDAIRVRDRMNLTVTFDHRVMDGHEAGAFLQAVKRRLEAIGPDTPLY